MKRAAALALAALAMLAVSRPLGAQAPPAQQGQAQPAQEQAQPAQGQAPAQQGQAPTQGQDWYIGKEIKDFTFVGLESVSVNELRPIVRPYIGKPFTMDLFWEIQGKLYELDYFEQVDAEAKPADQTRTAVVVEFRVKERATIDQIRIEGNRRVSRSAILDKVLIKKGKFASQADVNLDIENIRTLYFEKGFPEVKVTGEMEKEEGRNSVIVTFRINEGQETRIKEIRFSGNASIPASALKGEMKTKEQGLFSSGAFRESQLQEDIKAIETYYQNRGYVDAKVVKVDRQTETDEQGQRVQLILTLYVDEGSQWFYGGMTYEGNKVFTNAQIDALLKLKPGTVFNKQRVEAQYQSIVSLYTDSGYIYNVINRQQTRDDATKTISYKLTIHESDKAHIESIILQGNKKTKDYVILRELPFEEGDIFSVQKIRQGYLNLYNLQYFSSIDINPVEGSQPGLMDLVVSVEEQSWAQFKFALAFSGGDFPVSGQLGWSDSNFLGTGRTVGVDLEGSIYRQGIAANFKDDHLFGPRTGGAVTLSFYHNVNRNVLQDIQPPIFTDQDVPDPFTSEKEYEDALNSGNLKTPYYSTMTYDSIDISLGFTASRYVRTVLGRLGVSSGLSSTMTYVWYDPDVYRPYSSLVRDNLDTWDFVNTWGTTFYWDDRDIYYNPTKGFYLSQYFGLTGGFLFGTRQYIKLTTRGDGYQQLFSLPIGEKFKLEMVLAAHSELSFILPQLNGDLQLTPKDTLVIDGMTVGRGWDYMYDFRSMWSNSLELRIPIAKQFLWWTWFFDAVGAWALPGDIAGMSIEDFYFSYGGGLRFTIPGLPIRLYLAQAFKVVDGKIENQTGDIPLGPLELKFVISITVPGAF
jgi:outer membrane protein insertion porin family